METLLQDIRFGLRMLGRSPAFTMAAVLTLATGIGANTAIFTLLNAVLLRMLPVKDPNQLVIIGNPEEVHSRTQGSPMVDYFSAPLYRDLNQGSSEVFTGMLASGEVHRVRVQGENGEITNDATGVLASGNYFSVLGVNAFLGRVFNEEGAKGSKPVAVLSYGFWRDKLGGDRLMIGRMLALNGHPYTVIGVTPPGFFGDTVGDFQDFWVPLSMQEQLFAGRSWLDSYSASWLHSIGRLRPGVSLSRARAALNVTLQQVVSGPVGARFSKNDREELRQARIRVSAGGRGLSEVREHFFKPLMLLTAIVGLVLLMACCNVANLLLARATARRREFAVRLAIGAARSRLVRQLLTESIVLAFAGGLLGLLVAHWATSALLKLSDNEDLVASLDLRVLAFTAGICALTGVLFGLIPALRSQRIAVASTLKSAGYGVESAPRSFWGKALVAFQVSVSLVILFAAGLLSRSLHNMRSVDLGYNHEHILLVRADPLAAGYDVSRIAGFANEVISRCSTLPGVRAISYSKNGLFSGSESDESLAVEGFAPKSEEETTAAADYVGPGYFRAVGIPILLGRDISPEDAQASHRVAVINQSMARFYFGTASPIGRRFRIGEPNDAKGLTEIVGVAKDVRDHALTGAIPRRFYVPLTEHSEISTTVNFEVRTTGNPMAMAESVRKQITAFNEKVPVYTERTLNELVDESISNEILVARLSGVFGVVALLLACVGLYGIMSCTVGRRTKEIGVRMALGAQRSSMLWMVLRQTGTLVLIGFMVGMPMALAGSTFLASMLFGLKTTDPPAMAIAMLLLAAVAMLAGLVPARRATKVDPIVALRYE